MSLLKYLFLEPQSVACRYEFCHKDNDSTARAFDISEEACLRLDLPTSLGATEVSVEVFCADKNECSFEFQAKKLGRNENFDFYKASFGLPCGLYYLRPYILAYGERIYGRKSGKEFIFDGAGEMLQLTVSDFLYSEPKKIYGGIIYHIFVDRFRRGGNVCVKDYNTLVPGEWDVIPEYPEYPGAHLKNNTLYGGTLYGVIEKLDYIASLGCTAIYLSPVFESVSNHKYDTADYMKVDSCFGGDEALELLIKEARAREIYIILDGVFNHTGSDSRYFNRFGRYDSLGAYQSKESDFYDWYDFKQYPDKYTCWWDIEILPRINPDKPKCRKYFVGEGGVIDKYRKMGAYGFRLDVADELSDDFISCIKARLTDTPTNDGSLDSEAILYGEVWEDASNKVAYDTRKKYYLGSELDGVMNYPLRVGLLDYVLKGETDALRYYFDEVLENTPERILHGQMNLLGTHDTERILTLLGGVSSEGLSNAQLSVIRMSPEQKALAIKRLMSLYTVISSLPGVPAIFYGDEAGLEGYHDPFNRMPYPWGKEESVLLLHYKNVGKIRRDNEVYKKGGFKLLYLERDLLCFERYDGDFAYITVYNNGNEDKIISFTENFVSLTGACTGKTLKASAGGAIIVKTKKSGEIIL